MTSCKNQRVHNVVLVSNLDFFDFFFFTINVNSSWRIHNHMSPHTWVNTARNADGVSRVVADVDKKKSHMARCLV